MSRVKRHCCYGICNGDSVPGRPGYEEGLRFYRFPQPCLLLRDNVLNWDDAEEKKHLKDCKKCQIVKDWMIRCKRDDARFKRVRQISPNFFICSKHFVDPPAGKMDYTKFVPCSTPSATARRRSHEKYQVLVEKRQIRLSSSETPNHSFTAGSEQPLGLSETNDMPHHAEEDIPVDTSEEPDGIVFQEVNCSSTSQLGTDAKLPLEKDTQASLPLIKIMVDKETQTSLPPAKIMVVKETQASLPSKSSPKASHDQDMTKAMNRITELKFHIKRLEKEISLLRKVDATAPVANFEKKVLEDEKMCHFYTGMNHGQLQVVQSLFSDGEIVYWGSQSDSDPSKKKKTFKRRLTRNQEILIFFVRVRGGLLVKDISYRFNLSTASVGRIVTTWVLVMKNKFDSMREHMFPPREIIRELLPPRFKTNHFKNLRVIIDCAEFFVQRPSNFEQQGNSYSEYKAHTTFKVLIGCAPNGALTFISDLFEGSISDRAIVEQSGFIDLLEEGDLVLADRGFTIKDLTDDKGVILKIPAFLKGRDHLTPQEEIETKIIARNRIFVEHVVGRLKNYRLLQRVIPLNMTHIVSSLVFVCACLINFQDPFVK